MTHRDLDDLIIRFKDIMPPGPNILGAFFERHDWRPCWDLSKTIQEAFNSGVRYPTREEQQGAWKKFNELRDEPNTRVKDERNLLQARSSFHKKQIMGMCRGIGWTGDHMFDLESALCPASIDTMKTRQGYLAKAMKYFSEVKHEMLREDKDECFKEIQRVKDEHDRFWNQCNKAKEDKRQKYVAGQETFRNKIKENLSQNRDKLKNAEDALERFQEKASSVRDKIKNEKASEKWRTIWEGWLADALAKVESTKSYIEKLKEWIREGEAKLDGLK